MDFYRDLWELGTLREDTILVNLETSKRLMLESTTIEDFVLSHLLYYRALTATNLALATSVQADSRAIQGALLPFSFSDKDMEQLLQGEIGYRQAILSTKESSFFEKESWLLEATSDLFQQYLQNYRLEEFDYWYQEPKQTNPH